MYEVGTEEWFVAVFWPINPIASSNGADEHHAYHYANLAIGTTLPDGTTLTWEILLKRYTDYYNYKQEFQNGKYTRKDDRIMSIEDYCYNKLYVSDYGKIQQNSTDAYLFGI